MKNRSLEDMGLAHTYESKALSRRYDFYFNESCMARMNWYYTMCSCYAPCFESMLTKAIGRDYQERIKALIMLDLFGNIDGGDVALSNVNRILASLGAETVRRSDILLRHLRSYTRGFSGEKENYFAVWDYSDAEVEEAVSYADRKPNTLKGQIALVYSEIWLFFELLEREVKLGHRISAHLPVSVYPGMRIKRVDEEWGLLQEVYDRYTDTGTIALPGIVARELNRIRATDFHFEDKALEIKLRNVVESGFGLTKERTLEILDEHKLILRKEFFVDSTATGEMKDPWERGYKQERYLKARETILAACVNAESCTAAGDHDEARNQYRILKRDIDEYELEGNCPESRKLAIRIYAGRGDLYAQMGEADLAMSSYKDAAELAEMMLNSERSDEVYTALAVLDNKIGEMYGRCGDALNASAYRKISDCFMSNCTVPAQASTDTKDIYPGLWNE